MQNCEWCIWKLFIANGHTSISYFNWSKLIGAPDVRANKI